MFLSQAMAANLTDADVRAPKRQRTSEAVLQCQVCHRSYERADHLNRHLDSREVNSS
jgi:hypothetical protein